MRQFAVSHPRDGSDYAILYAIGEYRWVDHGGYDDYRSTLFIPPHLVDAWMGSECARRGITRESAVEHQEKFSKCYGAEIYAWAAEHLEPETSAR